MKFISILYILIVTVLCSNLCSGLFVPLLKELKKKFIYNIYAPSYGYRSPYIDNGYGYSSNYYGGVHGNSGYNARPYYSRRYQGNRKRTGRTYNDIARVINGNPYAFVGSRPFPAQPFHP